MIVALQRFYRVAEHPTVETPTGQFTLKIAPPHASFPCPFEDLDHHLLASTETIHPRIGKQPHGVRLQPPTERHSYPQRFGADVPFSCQRRINHGDFKNVLKHPG